MSTEGSELVKENNTDTIIVCFGGFALKMGGIPPYDFLNFLGKNFNADKIFYRDLKQMCYHYGIDGISKDIDTTVAYLKTKLTGFRRVIFTGTSAGAYAAILFGSLLNVSEVLVFNPITILYGRRDKYNLRYVDLSKDVINGITQYYLYGDISIQNEEDLHHIKHCKNISQYPNVHIIYKNGVNLKTMKTSGELYNIYDALISGTLSVSAENFVPQ